MHLRRRFRLALFFAFTATAAVTPALHAQTTITYNPGDNNSTSYTTTTDNPYTLTIRNIDSATQSGVISGNGTVTKDGDGTLTLSGNNTYTGGTTISSGTLQLGSDNALGTGLLTITGGELRAVDSPRTLTNAVALNGDFTLGRFTNLSGLITLGQDVTLTSANPDSAGPTSSEISEPISGSHALTFANGVNPIGTIILSGTNTYTGGTTISSGTLQLGNGGTTGSVVGDIANNGSLVFNRSDSPTYSGTISGSGSVKQTGSGILILAGANTYTGTTAVVSGTLQFAKTQSFYNSAVTSANAANLNVATGATAAFNVGGTGEFTSAQLDTLRGNAGFASGSILGLDTTNASGGTFSYASTINGSISLAKLGTGTLALSGANAYTGNTILGGGTLALGGAGAIGSSGTIVFNGGTLQFSAANATDYSSRFSSAANQSYNIDTNGQNVTFATALNSSGGSLTKSGSGILTLSGANTYAGGTTISAGTLALGASERLANAGAVTVNGGTLDLGTFNETMGAFSLSAGALTGTGTLTASSYAFSSSSPLAISASLAGSAPLTQTGAGTLTFSSNNTYTGGTTIASGTLLLGTGGTTGSVVGNIVDNAALIFNRSDNPTYAGAISGSGTLTQTGSGTLTLTGANTYTGNTTISAGALQFAKTQSFYNSAVTSANAANLNVATGATAIFNVGGTGEFTSAQLDTLSSRGGFASGSTLGLDTTNASGGTFTHAGSIGGALSLTKLGSGTLALSGANTYTGNTTISAGILDFAQTQSFYNNTVTSTTAANLNVAAGATAAFNVGGTGEFTSAQLDTLRGAGFVSGARLGLDPTNASGGTFTYASDVGGSLGLAKLGSGNLTLSGAISGTGSITQAGTGILALSGNNTYTGGTTVSSGTLLLGSASGVSSGTVTIAGGAIFDTANFGFDLSRVAGTGTLTGSGVFNSNSSSDTTLSPALAGTASLTKSGAGTLTLSSSNTYTGGTTVSSGTLAFGGSNLLAPTGAMTVNGGTLALGTFNETVGTFSLTSGSVTGSGTLAPSSFSVNNTSASILTVGGTWASSGSFTKSGDGELSFSGTMNITGGVFISGGTFFATGTNPFSGAEALTVNGGSLLLGGSSDVSVKSVTVSSGLLIGGGHLLTANNSFTFNNDSTVSVTGLNLNSKGSFTKTGAGLLDLIGSNVKSPGGIVISAGTLRVRSNGTINSALKSDVVDNASLVFNGRTYDFSNNISGSGSVTQQGPGTLTFYGTNTYTGGTIINAGTLALGVDDALGTGTVTINGGELRAVDDVRTLSNAVALNGSFNLGRFTFFSGPVALGNDVTITLTNPDEGDGVSGISGSISGTHGLALVAGDNRSGLFVLSGNNTYTGGTTISGIELQIGDGGTNGSVVGDIATDSALIFNRSDSLTYAGVISGSGSVTQAGGGTLILTGDSSYTGGTTLSSGTLQLGNGGATGSVAGDISNNGTLVFNHSNALTYSNTISGSGSVIQAGTGTLAFTGANSYAGGTTISSGTISINNTSDSAFGSGAVNVMSGATLTGTGSFTGALTLAAGATLSPGNSPGLMTIGSGSMLAGTTLMEIAGLTRGSTYDAINVGGAGALTFGGTLQVTFLNGFTPAGGEQFALFNFATGSSTFGTLNLPSLASGLSWDSSALYTTGVLSVAGSAIPEPSAYAAIFGACALGLGALVRRNSRSEGGWCRRKKS